MNYLDPSDSVSPAGAGQQESASRDSARHRPHPGQLSRPLLVCLGLLGFALGGRAAETTSAASLADLSLEQLMNETVTSVSKKEQKLGDAAAAVAVLSNDDLRRSGATSVAEALRWVPGMNVSGFNSSQWAISARGFNGLYANKLLVLVDGRAVYTPLFSGVYWDLQQAMLADVDRIEVIRGPGATVWGANAVNGVINVVSRSARETPGGFAYAGGGDVHQALGGARYGGTLGSNTFFRVFGSYQLNNDYPRANGSSANDGWSGRHGGFRLDHYADAQTHATWQADATQSDLDDHASDAYNVNMLGRWTRAWSDRSSVEVQAYYDRTDRNDSVRAHSIADTLDLSMQHTFGFGEHHDVIWGLGYRLIGNHITPTTPLVAVLDRNFDLNVVSAFIQDDWKLLADTLTVTVGAKFEHNDFTGLEIQPGVRAVFKPAENQTVWAAFARAVRTPSALSGRITGAITAGAPFVGPGGFTYVPMVVGNPATASEILQAYELGYRYQPTRRVNLEINTFYNHYDRIIAAGPIARFVPGTPGVAEIPWGNYQDGCTYGGEASVTVAATEAWRLTASYSLLIAKIEGVPASNPKGVEDGSPRNQASLRSAYDFSKQFSLDLQCRYVDTIRAVSSHLTTDFRLSYRPTEQLELSLVGQNLLDKQHPEARAELLVAPAEVPRGFYAKITWQF